MGRSDATHVPVVVGDIVGGRYRVEAVLGQGGMAIVYRARHIATGRLCALKLVHSHLVTNPQLIDLFVKETQVGARVGQNPHIVDVTDAGVDEARRVPFLAMELLDGETLEQYLENRGPPPLPLLREVLDQLADALDQAHAAGVVHRDLKPSNLFLTYDRKKRPVLKVLDFGIAKVLELEAQRTATQVGTPAYAAPEQMGPTLRKIAERQRITIATGVSSGTDVWALGLITYELFTAHPTGQYWGVEAITELPTKVVLDEQEPPSRRAGQQAHLLPAGFDAWFARCLHKTAGLRWPSARIAVDELLKLLPHPARQTVLAGPVDVPVGVSPTGPTSAATVPMLPSGTQISHGHTNPSGIRGSSGIGPMVTFLAVGALLVMTVTSIVLYVRSRASEEKYAATAAEQERERAERVKLERQLKEQNAKIERLLADLTAAKDEAQRLVLQKQLEEAQAAQKKLQNSMKYREPACKCVAGDPLCSCL